MRRERCPVSSLLSVREVASVAEAPVDLLSVRVWEWCGQPTVSLSQSGLGGEVTVTVTRPNNLHLLLPSSPAPHRSRLVWARQVFRSQRVHQPSERSSGGGRDISGFQGGTWWSWTSWSRELWEKCPCMRVECWLVMVHRYLPKQVTTQLSSQLQLLYILGLHVRHPLSSSQQSFSCYY